MTTYLRMGGKRWVGNVNHVGETHQERLGIRVIRVSFQCVMYKPMICKLRKLCLSCVSALVTNKNLDRDVSESGVLWYTSFPCLFISPVIYFWLSSTRYCIYYMLSKSRNKLFRDSYPFIIIGTFQKVGTRNGTAMYS